MKIKMRAFVVDGRLVGLLVPLKMGLGNKTVDLGPENATVECLVLDGDDRMHTRGFRVKRFHQCPEVEFEIEELELVESPASSG